MSQTMNSSRYEEIINIIKEKIKYYELALENNKFFFTLANGDYVNLTFPRNNISHLLGIYTDKLKSANIVPTNTSSYDILKKLTNDDLTYMSLKTINCNFDINSLFSEFIDSKLDIFTNILKVRSDDMYCIIKYCSDRTYTTGEEKENSEYFIIRKHDKMFSVLGIVRNGNHNDYVPVTSRLFNSYEELNKFLSKVAKNQEVTYPVNFRIDNYEKEYSKNCYPNLEEKLEFNRILKDIAFKHSAIPSTNRDFLALIERFLNNKQKNSNNTSILTLIRESITSGNVIDKEEVNQIIDSSEIPTELDLLIDAANDLICSRYSSDKTASTSYSSIQSENISLKDELEKLKKQILELKEKTTKLEEENNNLKDSNYSNSQKLKVLTDAFEKIKTI